MALDIHASVASSQVAALLRFPVPIKVVPVAVAKETLVGPVVTLPLPGAVPRHMVVAIKTRSVQPDDAAVADGGILESARVARRHAAGVAKAKAAWTEVETTTHGVAAPPTLPACLGATDGRAEAPVPVVAGPVVTKGQEGVNAAKARSGLDVDEAVVVAVPVLLLPVLTILATASAGRSAVRPFPSVLILPLAVPNPPSFRDEPLRRDIGWRGVGDCPRPRFGAGKWCVRHLLTRPRIGKEFNMTRANTPNSTSLCSCGFKGV